MRNRSLPPLEGRTSSPCVAVSVKINLRVRKSFPTKAIRKGKRLNLFDLPAHAYSWFVEGFASTG
jgi:hypothetical protein